MKIINIIKASKAIQYVLIGTAAAGAITGGVLVYNNVSAPKQDNQEIKEPVKELTEKDQMATPLKLKEYDIELNSKVEDLEHIDWGNFVENFDELTDEDKTTFYGINFEEVDTSKEGSYNYYIRYDDKTYNGKINVKKAEEVKNPVENTINSTSQKENNSGSKSSSNNTKSNNSSNQSNSCQSAPASSTSTQYIPVGTTYTNGAAKVTILEGNKAKLEFNGAVQYSDVVNGGSERYPNYRAYFPWKLGSGTPKYYEVDHNVLGPTTAFAEGGLMTDINGLVTSLQGHIPNKFMGIANGYSCIPDASAVSNSCNGWMNSVRGNKILSEDYQDMSWYVINENLEVLGYVFLEATLKPESEWVNYEGGKDMTNVGDPRLIDANWNVRQVYR